MSPAMIDRTIAQGALFTTPVPVSQLKSDNRTCPICYEQYINPSETGYDQQPSEQEWAVSVDMTAEWFGLKRCCGHTIGKKCLAKHLHAPGPWSNKCPICRDVWFCSSEDTRVSAQQQSRQDHTTQGSNTVRRSRRIANQMIARSAAATRNRTRITPHSERTFNRRQSCRSAGFTQRLLEALEVPIGSDKVACSLHEAEGRLKALYSRTESA